MANPSALSACNRILEHAGEPTVLAADFDAETSLSKIALQCKRYLDKANRRLGRQTRLRINRRTATLSLTNASNTYSLPTGVLLEDLEEDSLIIADAASFGQHIKYMPYQDWVRMWPAGETVKGRPVWFFDYPADGTNIDKLGFSQPPGANYTVKYQYYKAPNAITVSTDQVILDDRFVDVLWDHGQMWLEVSKAEGKAADYAAILDSLVDQLKQANQGSLEKPPGIDLGFSLCGTMQKYGGRRRAYSPN